MKIDITENGQIQLTKVHEPILLKTSEGNTLTICMRDDTLEMKVVGSDKWYVYAKDKKYGPYSLSELKEYLREGRISKDSLCRIEGGDRKHKVSEIPGLHKKVS